MTFLIVIIGVAIPSDSTKTNLKYSNFSIEIQRMWNLKCLFIPVIIGAMRITTKGLKYIWKEYQESIQ
jgi:hypothetical protein